MQLIPNVITYENWTVLDGDHIELSDEKKQFLQKIGHKLQPKAGGAICQLIVQNLKTRPMGLTRKLGKMSNDTVFYGILTAVSDPRKDGRPAAI